MILPMPVTSSIVWAPRPRHAATLDLSSSGAQGYRRLIVSISRGSNPNVSYRCRAAIFGTNTSTLTTSH